MKTIFGYLILLGLLAACSSVPVSTATLAPGATNTGGVQSSTTGPTQTLTPLSPTVTAELPIITTTPVPQTATPAPACVLLYYGGYAQFEVISPNGQRVLVDIYDPGKISSPAVESDILLTTHTHWDHLNEDFQTNFPGLQLFVQTGVLEVPGAIIQGIASSHNVGDRLRQEGGTNYIYLIEIGGLRIAHFGDIGQKALTEEQLTVLGAVDIAITQINNPYSEMNAENRKGINLMDQVQPRLIIPTHSNLDTIKLALEQWDGYYTESPRVKICESDLSQNGTKLLLMGEVVETMVKYVDLEAWGD